MVSFDLTFKDGGGLGSFLNDPNLTKQPEDPEGESESIPLQHTPVYGPDGTTVIGVTELLNPYYMRRLAFDHIFRFLLILLLLNMVAGILIF